MACSHLSVPTQFIEVDGVRFAYRRWGNIETDQPPLFFLQHFRGGMDHWNPLMTDGLADGREIILYNGRGVASSQGSPRNRIEDMADDAAAVIRALGLSRVDVLGFSLGGFQAQDLTRRHPVLVRKLMLLGTGPRGGDPRSEQGVLEAAPRPVPTLEDFLYLFLASQKPDARPARRSGNGGMSANTRIRPRRWRLCRPRLKPTSCFCHAWTKMIRSRIYARSRTTRTVRPMSAARS